MGLFGDNQDSVNRKEQKKLERQQKDMELEQSIAASRQNKRARLQNETLKEYKQIKYSLVPKDGHLHVIMIRKYVERLVDNSLINNLSCDEKYTGQLDMILHLMQNDGYEIIDVKFNSSLSGNDTRLEFQTLISYK